MKFILTLTIAASLPRYYIIVLITLGTSKLPVRTYHSYFESGGTTTRAVFSGLRVFALMDRNYPVALVVGGLLVIPAVVNIVGLPCRCNARSASHGTLASMTTRAIWSMATWDRRSIRAMQSTTFHLQSYTCTSNLCLSSHIRHLTAYCRCKHTGAAGW